MSARKHHIQIRTAVETDLEEMARIQACTLVASAYYDHSLDEAVEYERLHPRVSGYFAGTYHPGYALEDRAMFVAIDQKRIVGFIAGHCSTRMGCTAELQWMFVLPQWQRKGIGAGLLEPLRQWFKVQSSTRVIIDAPPENPYRAFYLKHGAFPLDEYWLYWENIGERPSI